MGYNIIKSPQDNQLALENPINLETQLIVKKSLLLPVVDIPAVTHCLTLDNYAPLKNLGSTSLLSRQAVLGVSKLVCVPGWASLAPSASLHSMCSNFQPTQFSPCSDLSVLPVAGASKLAAVFPIWSLPLIDGHAAGFSSDCCLPRPPHRGAPVFL